MDLEKGAWRFYRYARDKFSQDHIRRTLNQISIAEKGHATLIYCFLQKSANSPATFEQFYQSLPVGRKWFGSLNIGI
jgi:rubrerythrin